MTDRNEIPCFVCGKLIGPAVVNDGIKVSPWDMPEGALIFRASGNYGSEYDPWDGPGEHLEILVCDEHVAEYARLGRVDRVKSIRVPKPPAKRERWNPDGEEAFYL